MILRLKPGWKDFARPINRQSYCLYGYDVLSIYPEESLYRVDKESDHLFAGQAIAKITGVKRPGRFGFEQISTIWLPSEFFDVVADQPSQPVEFMFLRVKTRSVLEKEFGPEWMSKWPGWSNRMLKLHGETIAFTKQDRPKDGHSFRGAAYIAENFTEMLEVWASWMFEDDLPPQNPQQIFNAKLLLIRP